MFLTQDFSVFVKVLLKKMKHNSRIPLITKLADAERLLSKEEYAFLQQDIFCSSIYEAAVCAKKRGTVLNEFRQSPIIIP